MNPLLVIGTGLAVFLAFHLGRQYGRGEGIAAMLLISHTAGQVGTKKTQKNGLDSARASQIGAAREGRQ